ncbi:UvrD-helicase domain-containing protein [Aquibacillus koreensis]|uniref:DNA 3'-5' helicase n=1 Tax=Aquibacillus koreensis TaxID=279446 RepID=A0A9X3WLB8_9BACI|nr:UvrD-helicase domain-containing protein [Aquibacillus koreensis]MCT2537710.1 UvrD-helicase domain-containing protein [Aquibacillus koreensis]MDC3420943.1 UvrD-helicase domain-containing protein [Aquibacillus koreensis]
MIKVQNFSNTPEGTKLKDIPNARLADHKTSVELVADVEEDASYFRALEADNIKLNKPQIEAVRHVDGPALVLAGAGSGKTRVLTTRTGYLISRKNINPKSIMLVTFTKKAADEMKSRMHQLPGLSMHMINQITIGTFHSIFFRLLRSKGYAQQVLSSEKRKQLAIKLILKEKKLQDTYEPETLLALLSSHKTNILSVNDLPASSTVEKEIKEILIRYEQWKEQNHYIDFDDMLMESLQLLRQDNKLLVAMQRRFNYILCDEWQDTNPIQFELIKLIAKPNNNLFVVGDDDQTIYSFNGADRSIILNFENLYPNAKKMTLDINYRSTTSILGLGNEVIKYNQHRHPKTLQSTKSSDLNPLYLRPNTTDEEAEAIIMKIKEDIQSGKRDYRDFVILHRTNSSSRAIFDQLVLQGIPFLSYSKGETFYEQPIVQPIIDYLRLSLEPNNLDAISSILPSCFLNRDKAMYHLEAEQVINPDSNPLKHLRSLRGLKPFQTKQIEERVALIKTLKDIKPIQAIKLIRKFYDNYLETNERKNVTLHKEILLETLSEVEASAQKYDKVVDFITFVDDVIGKNKEMETIRRTPNANAVSLMTIHRSKGLEFPVVFLSGATEGILPHSSALEASDRKDLISEKKGAQKIQAALEEERRLAYVAITRAEQELYISSPAYYRGEKVAISRFITDPFTPEAEQQKDQTKAKGTAEVLVWDCTSPTCKCWMRITTAQEADQEQRECPMCKEEMVQATKNV